MSSRLHLGDELGHQLLPFSLARLQFPVRSRIRTLSRTKSRPDLKGSSAARISSSAALRWH
jgi:hypothetical protein